VLLYYNTSLLRRSSYMKKVALNWLSVIYMLAYIQLILSAVYSVLNII